TPTHTTTALIGTTAVATTTEITVGNSLSSLRQRTPEKLSMRKNSITLAALAVTMLAGSAHAGAGIKSATATQAQLPEYRSQAHNHGLRAVNTTATTLHALSGQPYAVFTVDAAVKTTGLPVQLAMIYDVNAKVMYALWPNQANRFLTTGDRSLLK